jgi:catechol 2,3-dioxygenase-like lactoylglutathione lyase family enzyme
MALTRISLTAREPEALALFYQTALGFRRVEAVAPAEIDGARVSEFVRLAYGPSEIDIVGFDPPGLDFPAAQAANDLSFQHFAMITPDIAAAVAGLRGTAGWRAISAGGPVRLPAGSGGAAAFKFRDPEGHPLEFLQPATGAVPRIDHSAIVVSDTAASMKFYETLGLRRQGGSLNQGVEQAALDGISDPVVEVTRLGDAAGILHLELLCYRPAAGAAAETAVNDVAATRLVFSGDETGGPRKDPDGHAIFLERAAHAL